MLDVPATMPPDGIGTRVDCLGGVAADDVLDSNRRFSRTAVDRERELCLICRVFASDITTTAASQTVHVLTEHCILHYSV